MYHMDFSFGKHWPCRWAANALNLEEKFKHTNPEFKTTEIQIGSLLSPTTHGQEQTQPVGWGQGYLLQ